MVRLSKRLQAVAGLVESCGTVADIGTDHGYIPIYLLSVGRAKRAVAMDVNEGPLQRAREHIARHGLEGKVSLRLSDGLAALAPGEAEVLVAAGMGGALIMRILEQGKETALAAKSLVLQPQSEVPAVRRFLQENGYRIVAEDMVFEDGKFYPMLAARPVRAKGCETDERRVAGVCGDVCREATDVCGNVDRASADVCGDAGIFWKYGPLLLRQQHPVLGQFLLRRRKIQEKILANLDANARGDVAGRRAEVRKELADIEAALSYYGKDRSGTGK